MIGSDVFMMWILSLSAFLVFMSIDEDIKCGKKNVAKGHQFIILRIKEIVGLIITIYFAFGCGYYGRSVLPVAINQDYQVFSGKVKMIDEQRESTIEGRYDYDGVTIVNEDECIVVDDLHGPLIQENDIIVYYNSSDRVFHKPIILLNGKDVSEIYGKWFSSPEKSTIVSKTFWAIYLIVFSVFHTYLFRKNHKEYKVMCQRKQYFFFKRNIEKIGYRAWGIGASLFLIVAIVIIIGIGNNQLLGTFMEGTTYLYLIGYWLVVTGKNRHVIYNGKCVKITYANGWGEEYALDQILSIESIKGNKYKMLLKSKKMVKFELYDEKQKAVLDELMERVELCTNWNNLQAVKQENMHWRK